MQFVKENENQGLMFNPWYIDFFKLGIVIIFLKQFQKLMWNFKFYHNIKQRYFT